MRTQEKEKKNVVEDRATIRIVKENGGSTLRGANTVTSLIT